MIDLKPTILTALEANATLTTILGLDKFNIIPIYQTVAKDPEKYPRVTFFELSNIDPKYADDVAITSEIGYQIDVWSLGSTFEAAAQIDLTMKSLNFKRISSQDLYESDMKIFHKAMRYETIIEL
ncbi:MAG: conserved phage protein [Bacilli bacterium]|nr:conserved phage protein [Bacilli bacterium]